VYSARTNGTISANSDRRGSSDYTSSPSCHYSRGRPSLTPLETTIVLLDQPTIVPKSTGPAACRKHCWAIVGLRYGGMQPANRSKKEMFGTEAPVWEFLKRFGGAANPLGAVAGTLVIETYPVLAMIALNWTQPDLSPQGRPAGRLPKYNPERNKTFSPSDWQYVCGQASVAISDRGLKEIVQWIDGIALEGSAAQVRPGRPRCVYMPAGGAPFG
jgi:predicted RNase H-like nuclease